MHHLTLIHCDMGIVVSFKVWNLSYNFYYLSTNRSFWTFHFLEKLIPIIRILRGQYSVIQHFNLINSANLNVSPRGVNIGQAFCKRVCRDFMREWIRENLQVLWNILDNMGYLSYICPCSSKDRIWNNKNETFVISSFWLNRLV